jgi:predicted AAA+ superfamily ATPase
MYSRIWDPPKGSFFLFGPRGVGKSSLLRLLYADAPYFDLLDAGLFVRLQADPSRLESSLPKACKIVVIDEIQRIPELLNEVHRLIENRGMRFALTGSSARSLRRRGVNLLAGRAVTRHLHPFVAHELGSDFQLQRFLANGGMPSVWQQTDAKDYLASYVATYLKEEVLHEGLTRNLGAFYRFLEAASFSQGQLLNISAVARDCSVERKVVESYFQILEDLLLGVRLAPFTRRAKRAVVTHPKFYFFDCGIFRAIRPRGPLDLEDEISGAAIETAVFQHLRAWNDYSDNPFSLHFWRSRLGDEVDFVLYGPGGLHAIEVKRTAHPRAADLGGLRAFKEEYDPAQLHFVYTGQRREFSEGVNFTPLEAFLTDLPKLFGK